MQTGINSIEWNGIQPVNAVIYEVHILSVGFDLNCCYPKLVKGLVTIGDKTTNEELEFTYFHDAIGFDIGQYVITERELDIIKEELRELCLRCKLVFGNQPIMKGRFLKWLTA